MVLANTPLELTRDEWRLAEQMARDLARDVDRNEFKKVITYLQRTQETEKFLILLQQLPTSAFIRSNRTRAYFERIGAACRRYLQGLPTDRALLVSLWAFRLMTYYD